MSDASWLVWRTVGRLLEDAKLALTVPSELDRYRELEDAARDAEEVMRLIHEAAGPVEKDAPMPKLSTFEAWRALRRALDQGEGSD